MPDNSQQILLDGYNTMGILDDTAIFVAIIQQGGLSHAAKHLGLSNGLISRRLSQLEADLGVTLIKRTTRQIHLTPEGALFWQHAARIQQELDSAVSVIQSTAKNPQGRLRVSAPVYFGRHYLTPIILKFMQAYPDIKIDLILTNQQVDLIKSAFDLVVRGAGYLDAISLQDSSLQMKVLVKEKIGLYASEAYLKQYGEPTTCADLSAHSIINFTDESGLTDEVKWSYHYQNENKSVSLHPVFNVNDIASGLTACTLGHGIGKFTALNVRQAVEAQQLRPVLSSYDWGHYQLYLIYPHQQALPARTRLLLEFIQKNIPYNQ